MTLLEKMAYAPTIQYDHGVLINIDPNQFLTTEREFAELCNLTKPSDMQRFNRCFVQRFWAKLRAIQFSIQKVIHKKTLLTISQKYILEMDDPRIDHKMSQTRAIKEEIQEIQEIQQPQTPNRIYDCVVGLNLSHEEKTAICRNRNEEQVKIGLAWAAQKKTPFQNFVGFVIFMADTKSDYPEIQKKLSIFEEISLHFIHGEKYFGAECNLTRKGISFTRGMKHRQQDFNDFWSWDNFLDICDEFNIEFSRNHQKNGEICTSTILNTYGLE
jgi:hypothetical protein